jgi:hypothetical protein
MDWLLRMGLSLDGVSPETIAKLDAIMPDLDHLALVLRAEMPRVNKVTPVLVAAFEEAVLHKNKPSAPAAPAYDAKGAVKPKRFW